MAAVFRVDMEQQGYQSRSGRLSREPGCCQHTAGASASLGRCGGDQDAVVGRLEQAESEAAEQESPDDVGDVGLLGQKSQQNHARRHDKQSYAAHGSCVDPFDQQAGDRSHDHNDSGPGSEDQARMYFCISECLLQVEGKRDHSEHLGDERADRGDDRNREDRDAQQVEGEDRIGFVELAAHEQCADEDQQDDAYSDIAGFEAVRVTFDRSDQQSEGEGVHQPVPPVEVAAPDAYRIFRQESVAQQTRDESDRDVDSEKPGPGGDGENARSQCGAGHRGDGYDRSIHAHSASQVPAGVYQADQRGIDARDGCRPESLADAGRDQRGERVGQRAAQ